MTVYQNPNTAILLMIDSRPWEEVEKELEQQQHTNPNLYRNIQHNKQTYQRYSKQIHGK